MYTQVCLQLTTEETFQRLQSCTEINQHFGVIIIENKQLFWLRFCNINDIKLLKKTPPSTSHLNSCRRQWEYNKNTCHWHIKLIYENTYFHKPWARLPNQWQQTTNIHHKKLAHSACVQAYRFNSVQGSANTEMQSKAKQCKNELTNFE